MAFIIWIMCVPLVIAQENTETSDNVFENCISLVEKTTPETVVKTTDITSLSKNVAQPMPTPTRNLSARSMTSDKSESVSVANNITELLVFWNENLHWDLSRAQIDEYAMSIDNSGVLKKYMTNPDYPHALFIPDEHQFYREVGGALGYNQSESEDFIQALDDYQRQNFESNCPQWETCGPPKPIVLNFSVKPRLRNTVPVTNSIKSPKPSPPSMSVSSGPFGTSENTNSASQNFTEMILPGSPLEGIVRTWEDLLKKVAGIFQVR
jgi:hypothetical protein